MNVALNIIMAIGFTLLGIWITMMISYIGSVVAAKRSEKKLLKERELTEAENQRKLMEAILDKLNKE